MRTSRWPACCSNMAAHLDPLHRRRGERGAAAAAQTWIARDIAISRSIGRVARSSRPRATGHPRCATRRRQSRQRLFRTLQRRQAQSQTDYGLIASARQRFLDGESAGAWRLLQSRIDALLAIREPSRQEAEALALMARHAVGLPGADPRRLQAARQIVERIAARDGAGPGVPGCVSAPSCCVVRSAAPVRGSDAPRARFPIGRRRIFSPCD